MEITYKGLKELNKNYPWGKPYDNLFNAEHRDLMIERHGFTQAQFIKVQDLLDSVS